MSSTGKALRLPLIRTGSMSRLRGMTRWGIFWRYGQTVAGSYGMIDHLTLTYNGNRLQAVRDACTNSVYGNGTEFKDNSNQTVEYAYDKNGNLIKDLN
ncbi:hypothetical protein E5981_18940, partial [Bacteroides faecichinchillae]